MKIISYFSFSLIILLASVTLPLIALEHPEQIKGFTQHKAREIANNQYSRSRLVQPFKSTAQLSEANSFAKARTKITTSNLNITIINNARFNLNLKFANYNQRGQINSDSNLLIQRQEDITVVSVGVGLLSRMTVKVDEPGQYWAKLQFQQINSLDFNKVDPTSISYEIRAVGALTTANITLYQTYSMRANPSKVNRTQFGVFNVYNLAKSAKVVISAKLEYALVTIATWIITTVLAILLTVGIGAISKYLYSRFSKSAIGEGENIVLAQSVQKIEQQLAPKVDIFRQIQFTRVWNKELSDSIQTQETKLLQEKIALDKVQTDSELALEGAKRHSASKLDALEKTSKEDIEQLRQEVENQKQKVNIDTLISANWNRKAEIAGLRSAHQEAREEVVLSGKQLGEEARRYNSLTEKIENQNFRARRIESENTQIGQELRRRQTQAREEVQELANASAYNSDPFQTVRENIIKLEKERTEMQNINLEIQLEIAKKRNLQVGNIIEPN